MPCARLRATRPTRRPSPAAVRAATRTGRRAAAGAGGAAVSAAARRTASPRRVNGGGWASSTVAPASTSCAAGSRSTTRSPTTSGRGCDPSSRVSRAWSAAQRSHPHRRGGGADVQGGVRRHPVGERVQHDVDHAGRGRPAGREQRAAARHRSRRPPPRRLTASRVGPAAVSTGSPCTCRPRTRTGSPSISRVPPRVTDPVGRVPVTTVPAPVTVNERSTHRRTGACGSPTGARSASAASAARTSARPAPVRAEAAATATGRMPCAASRASASAVAGPGSARSAPGHDEGDVGQAQRPYGRHVLLGLGPPALVGGDDEQHPGHRPEPGQGGADQPVVPRHVDDRPPGARRRRPTRGRARWSCRAAAPRAAGRGRCR